MHPVEDQLGQPSQDDEHGDHDVRLDVRQLPESQTETWRKTMSKYDRTSSFTKSLVRISSFTKSLVKTSGTTKPPCQDL